MRTSILITTMTAALLAGTSLVFAQNPNAEPKKEQVAPTVPMKSQDKMQPSAQKSEPANKSQTTGQAASPAEKKQQKAEPANKSQTTGQGGVSPSERRQPIAAPQGSGSSSQGQVQGQIRSESVNLTAEQKTNIRQSVLGARSAPRQTSVNFSLNVGTAVPNTIHLVAVPEPLIRIHPTWRGNLYFIVGEEIIIVDRRTHEIIAVLEV